MANVTDTRRRGLLLGTLGLLGLAYPLGAASRLLATPRQPAGPFYPLELPLDDDNDLTRVAGQSGVAEGRVADLSGRLLDAAGTPLEGLRVEIWQCDANGRYRHPRDPGMATPDPGFQGHGHTLTGARGGYRFRTIRPVPYPGRTPHIHAAVFLPGQEPFVTQIYVKGEPGNAEDFLFRRIPEDRRDLVLADFAPAPPGSGAELAASLDLVLGLLPAQG
jgi:protocatechuate 3,4-dioxygenase beta subunit